MPTLTRFENAPLLEVIAELRWSTARDTLMQQGLPGVPIHIPDAVGAADERFFERFGELMDGAGFRTSERTMPFGAPSMPGEAVVRYRTRANLAPILQIGPGVFTANGLPPSYTNWGDFRPTLQTGVRAMLEARDPIEAGYPMTLTVRYVDGFDERYWGDRGRGYFVDEVLGFGSKLPASVQEQLHAERPKSAAHQLTLPLQNDSEMVIQVGDGQLNHTPMVLLDVTVRTPDVAPEEGAVMEAFERAHGVIRDLFMSITQPVRDIMGPIEVEA